MQSSSQRVRRLGKTHCELCLRRGSESNPLSCHHSDGDTRNNDPANLMAVHRILCHTYADFVTQLMTSRGQTATPIVIKRAWHAMQKRGTP